MKLLLLATLLFSFTNAGAATLSENPGNIGQGGTVTSAWNAIAAPSNRDWIGVYGLADADAPAPANWFYINSCNKAGANAAAPASGSCSFLIPGSLTNGSYELRLYSNNSYTRLATSTQFSVGPVVVPTLQALTINSVAVNLITDTITISGANILSVATAVTLGGGDYSPYCSVAPTTPKSIVCTLGLVPGLPADGDYRLVVSQGASADQNDAFDFTIGSVGAQGPAGATGASGAAGAVGSAGPQGLQGPAGAAGASGAAGAIGSAGSQGPQGPVGAAGATGAAGALGFQGLPGAAGAQGLQGVTGPAGATGPQGPTGLTGAGATGAAGAQGPAGSPGATGAQGPVGPAGATGATGLQNLFGTGTNHANAGNGRECFIGEIILSAGGVTGGYPANGQLLPIVQNQALYSLLGINFGGNGVTTFGLPDLRGAAPNGLTYSICLYGIFPYQN